MPYNVQSILRLRNKIITALYAYPGTTPSGESYESLVLDTLSVLPPDVAMETVHSSLQHLAGKALSEKDIKTFAWRLAANLPKLKAGKAIRPWTIQKELEWVVVQVASALLCEHKKQLAYEYTLVALTGSVASTQFTKVWTIKFLSFMNRELGFTAPWGEYPFTNGLEIVGLRFLIELDPAVCRDKLVFDKVKVNSSSLNWNKSLIKMRNRDGFACPENYSTPCYLCWKGYASCPAACRPVDLKQKYCSLCENDSAWIDEEISKDVCVECFRVKV